MSEFARDTILLGGMAAISFGLWQWYQPAAWIFGGSVVAATAIALTRGTK